MDAHHTINSGSVTEYVFQREVSKVIDKYPHLQFESWEAIGENVEDLTLEKVIKAVGIAFKKNESQFTVLASKADRHGGKSTAILAGKAGEEALLTIGVQYRTLYLDVVATTQKQADADLAALVKFCREKFKEPREKTKDGVWAAFSHENQLGQGSVFTQFLKCPDWKAVEANYPAKVRERLAALASLEKPVEKGKLIILHGTPGTGKTYFIRSLMMEWADRYNFIIVTDPEKFAADPAYYFSIASQSNERLSDQDEEKHDLPAVFVLEDTAGFIVEESRTQQFEKVGKLLNMTDGLYGQGRNDIVMVTFNEAISKIDSAFTRPGRCIAEIEFTKFGRLEADQWMSSREAEGHMERLLVDHPHGLTLAEMYAQIGTKPAPAELVTTG